MKLTVKIRKLHPGAVLPRRSTASAAGADLCALLEEPLTVYPGETVFVHTGLSCEIPEGYGGFVFARSGLASKQGLAPANKVGVIDSDYRGEIMVALHNHAPLPVNVENGQRIAQLVIMPVAMAEYVEEEALSETERGAGGFGSTGK
ncbi:MAG: dUTP diphosphatase [Oscillospiraceae bacterium]|nr:dUTP diphosphatase [Oscillospiraceae bacterium]